MLRACILLASGDYFDFETLENSPIRIDDIANALSKECRYGGHCRGFYSVAQHSYYVSLIVPSEYQLHGLLHDAAEAYTGDMVKPLKEKLPDFKRFEKAVEREVFSRFGLSAQLPVLVHHADRVLLHTEQRDIMRNNDNWHWTDGTTPLRSKIKPWSWQRSKRVFLRRYRELTGTSTLLDKILINAGLQTL